MSGSTSNLMRHLKNTHKNKVDDGVNKQSMIFDKFFRGNQNAVCNM